MAGAASPPVTKSTPAPVTAAPATFAARHLRPHRPRHRPCPAQALRGHSCASSTKGALAPGSAAPPGLHGLGAREQQAREGVLCAAHASGHLEAWVATDRRLGPRDSRKRSDGLHKLAQQKAQLTLHASLPRFDVIIDSAVAACLSEENTNSVFVEGLIHDLKCESRSRVIQSARDEQSQKKPHGMLSFRFIGQEFQEAGNLSGSRETKFFAFPQD